MADNALLGPATAARRNVLLDAWNAAMGGFADAWRGPRSPITGGPMYDPRAVPAPTSGAAAVGQVLAEYQNPGRRGVGVNTVLGFTEGPAAVKAFHGSPHSFDKFDLERLGTGSGSQAFGHGLYFAENEAVARTYRPGAAAGHMYEVDLLTDPGRLLDWHAPLTAQPEGVAAALRPLIERGTLYHGMRAPLTGAEAYKVAEAAVGTLETKAMQLPRVAVVPRLLRDAGIDGVQYFDDGSRIAGDGTRNFVMFDADRVKILRRYGLLPLATGGTAAAVTRDD